jgi:hypothetical protein
VRTFGLSAWDSLSLLFGGRREKERAAANGDSSVDDKFVEYS